MINNMVFKKLKKKDRMKNKFIITIVNVIFLMKSISVKNIPAWVKKYAPNTPSKKYYN